MRIKPEEAKAGDAILWKGQGLVFQVLSFLLGLIDFKSGWLKRDWKPWHTGYIVRILPDDDIVTSQAVARGVEVVTYPSINDMGDCRIYRWLEEPDQEKIDKYTDEHNDESYDVLAYLWVFLGGISMIYFHHPFRVVNGLKMCWENLAEFCRYMGKEIQPEQEPPLLSRIVAKLEEKKK